MQLTPILNATGARWALGGSCNLALHGVQVEPQDIDISTDQYSAYQIGVALRKVGEEIRAVRWSESQRIRSHYGQYRIGGVQVDVIGAAEFREGDEWVQVAAPDEYKTDTVEIPGSDLTVPGLTLEYELEAYRRLGREAKVKLIEERLASMNQEGRLQDPTTI